MGTNDGVFRGGVVDFPLCVVVCGSMQYGQELLQCDDVELFGVDGLFGEREEFCAKIIALLNERCSTVHLDTSDPVSSLRMYAKRNMLPMRCLYSLLKDNADVSGDNVASTELSTVSDAFDPSSPAKEALVTVLRGPERMR